MNSWPRSGSDIHPASRHRSAMVVAILVALLVAALHLDCAVAGAESPDEPARVPAATSAPAHPGVHLPTWDDCCAHDRLLVMDSVLPADTAKHWLLGMLCWVVVAVALVPQCPAATAGRAPPGRRPFARTGRTLLTHLGIARR